MPVGIAGLTANVPLSNDNNYLPVAYNWTSDFLSSKCCVSHKQTDKQTESKPIRQTGPTGPVNPYGTAATKVKSGVPGYRYGYE